MASNSMPRHQGVLREVRREGRAGLHRSALNTGQAFTHYEDNITHSIWLTLLRDRIRQIRPLLADDASVWVHLDHMESHRCRVVLDEELGENNFVAEVAWQKADSPRNDSKLLSTSQDTRATRVPNTVRGPG